MLDGGHVKGKDFYGAARGYAVCLQKRRVCGTEDRGNRNNSKTARALDVRKNFQEVSTDTAKKCFEGAFKNMSAAGKIILP